WGSGRGGGRGRRRTTRTMRERRCSESGDAWRRGLGTARFYAVAAQKATGLWPGIRERRRLGRSIGEPVTLRRATVVLVLLSVTSTDRVYAQCPDGAPPPCRTATRPVSVPAPNSVAVLYFDNLSPDTADAYLADGLTEEITSRLGGVQRLQIKRPSRDAARRLRDTVPVYLVAVGRVLRVRYLVEGSVRRAGARVRVSVRLVKAANGFRSEEHTSELQSRVDLVCRLLLEKKKSNRQCISAVLVV